MQTLHETRMSPRPLAVYAGFAARLRPRQRKIIGSDLIMPKIAFLILDDVHHVHHLAPIAFELSRREEYECVIFIQAHSRSLIKKLAALYPHHRCRLRILSTSFITQIKYRLRQKRLHSRRIIECHIQKLLRYDAIISADSDMDQLIANSEHSAKKPLFFSTRHGAGDRPMDTFDSMKLMDLVFFPGKKYLKRFAGIPAEGNSPRSVNAW